MTSEFNLRHTDLCTERGFQFEFHCAHCGRGKCSSIIPRKSGGFATKLFGVFTSGQQSDPGERDAAFKRSVDEVRPQFASCGSCSKWVCENCWDNQKGKCRECADKSQLVQKTEAPKPVKTPEPKPTPVAKAAAVEIVAKSPSAVPVLPKLVTCPHCGAKAQTGKTCSKCSNSLEVARRCKNCPFVIPAGKKFCPRCGTSQ